MNIIECVTLHQEKFLKNPSISYTRFKRPYSRFKDVGFCDRITPDRVITVYYNGVVKIKTTYKDGRNEIEGLFGQDDILANDWEAVE
jgi:hypothetical protein